jgi:hypothetical protein
MVCTIAIQMPHSNDRPLAKRKCSNNYGCSIDSSLCSYYIRVFIVGQPAIYKYHHVIFA